MENISSSEALTEDQQMEILSGLPLETLVKFMLVSKKWESLIRSEDFRKLHLGRSLTRPRVMFIVSQIKFMPIREEVSFQSVYQAQPLLSSGQQKVLLSPDLAGYLISDPIGGLIRLQKNTEVTIFNPGTNTRLHLPKIQAPEGAAIRSFLGYDECTDVFKVLCILSKVTKEQKILTMGLDEKVWREIITCDVHPHSPVGDRGLCKGGVLYYEAWSHWDNSMMIMSFNMESEKFRAIELPNNEDVQWELVNYNEKIGLMKKALDVSFGLVDTSFDIWVRNGIEGNWSRNHIEIPRWESSVENINGLYFFTGATRTGKLVFSMKKFLPENDGNCQGSLGMVYYDPATRNLTSFKIEGEGDHVRTILDHVDTTWLM